VRTSVREPFFTRVEELVDQVRLDPDVARSSIIASISITSTPLAMTAVAVQNSTPERLD
jgi:hypothetical protein